VVTALDLQPLGGAAERFRADRAAPCRMVVADILAESAGQTISLRERVSSARSREERRHT
jgi:hypothetical protein